MKFLVLMKTSNRLYLLGHTIEMAHHQVYDNLAPIIYVANNRHNTITGSLQTVRNVGKAYRRLRKKMHLCEWLHYDLMLSLIERNAPIRYQAFLAASGSHPWVHMPEVEGKFHTILDVLEQIDPVSYAGSVT